MKRHKLSIFVFRRALRLEDNTGLLRALEFSEKVIPCFIFDKRQVRENSYKSQNSLQFLINSLKELDSKLRKKSSRLFLFYGIQEEILENLLTSQKIEAIFCNRDYTPFAIQRDEKIKNLCEKKGVEFYKFADYLLSEPENALKKDGTPYSIFTPFFRNASWKQVNIPEKISTNNFFSGKIDSEVDFAVTEKFLEKENPNIFVKGGRKEALGILTNLEKFHNYEEERNFPSLSKTTGLSAHLKFGTVSVREVYYKFFTKLGDSHPLIRQLYWRDFFTHIAFHFPQVFGNSFHKKYDQIEWKNDEKNFKLWCEGKTGFPIVDAGMRELSETGFMHNRVRMIVASFLVKDLHIDWRWGEKYFAKKLVDYDPSVNNGSWQWAASTGCDAQPYFRIFSPWSQQEKFDSDCLYIKKWIPELRNLEPKEIHKIWKESSLFASDYPRQIVEHKEASSFAKEMFKNCK
ncbi:MAG: deoxyribodipyrimidine photo-lyase [Calditrichaeota bacterium]|nr:MAG: deoxyribodipyrimidine photo-lyase [Calditrichota bacterium]